MERKIVYLYPNQELIVRTRKRNSKEGIEPPVKPEVAAALEEWGEFVAAHADQIRYLRGQHVEDQENLDMDAGDRLTGIVTQVVQHGITPDQLEAKARTVFTSSQDLAAREAATPLARAARRLIFPEPPPKQQS